MKIACLQFAPQLGRLKENIEKANAILQESAGDLVPPTDGRGLWLVLPEMAFTGYNFQSLQEITPFLEPCCAGPSTSWAIATARKLGIYVTVGYPETVARVPDKDGVVPRGPTANYNSTVTVSPDGAIVGTYRKRFLYYTDETWALEGDGQTSPSGFFTGEFPGVGAVSMGICMDINPYKFSAPWTKYEFANHVVSSNSSLVILSMAWLTTLGQQELVELPLQPDDTTFTYWIERFAPLREASQTVGPTVVVCANRCGIEGSACYAGTSSVFMFNDGKVQIYDVCGKYEESCMVVDLLGKPKYELQRIPL